MNHYLHAIAVGAIIGVIVAPFIVVWIVGLILADMKREKP
jgi:hypothetical protein